VLTAWQWQKLALTSPTSGGRSVGIVRSQIYGVCLFVCLFVYKNIVLFVISSEIRVTATRLLPREGIAVRTLHVKSDLCVAQDK
jgi:hypothetical protein